ncbi:hypothetical protein PG987_004703 [Apiospora arundinis]
MAYQQNQYPYPQYGSGGGGGNSGNGSGGGGLQRQVSDVSTPTTVYGRWERVAQRLRQPPPAHTSPPPRTITSPPPQYQPPPQQQQQQPQTWHQPPTSYAAEGIARAHHWVANNPNPPPPPSSAVVSPLSTNYTPGGGGGGFSPSVISYQAGTLPPRPETRQRMVCGIERTQFIIIMAITVMLLISGIATGLGVGLALDNSNKAHSSSVTPVSSSTPTTTPKPPSPSATSSTGSTGVAVPGPIRCPQDDHNVYVSAATPSRSFTIQCGRDYNSARGAQDLDHKVTATMAECLDECAGRPGCVGAGWGLYQGSMTCWMKKGLGEPNISDGWYFAQLQPSGSTGQGSG